MEKNADEMTNNWSILLEKKELLLKIGLRPESMAPLTAYIQHLWLTNKSLNLISRQMSFEDLINNHVIDCLLPAPLMPNGIKRIWDFGSGGGLPGIIYALQWPHMEVQLFEKSPKKQEFLKSCLSFAPNIIVKSTIPENFDHHFGNTTKLSAKENMITARGFKPLHILLELSSWYYQKGGRYFLLKGRREKIEEEIVLTQKKIKHFSPDKIEIKKLYSPVVNSERHLLLIL